MIPGPQQSSVVAAFRCCRSIAASCCSSQRGPGTFFPLPGSPSSLAKSAELTWSIDNSATPSACTSSPATRRKTRDGVLLEEAIKAGGTPCPASAASVRRSPACPLASWSMTSQSIASLSLGLQRRLGGICSFRCLHRQIASASALFHRVGLEPSANNFWNFTCSFVVVGVLFDRRWVA